MHTDPIDALQRQIQTFIRLFGALEQHRTPCGYPLNLTQAHALHELDSAGSLTQQELADRLRIDKSTASRVVDWLEKQGAVVRTVNPRNRRETLVSLTEKGKRMNGEIGRLRRRKYASLLERIPVPKREAVLAALELLNSALQEQVECPKE